MPSDIGQRQRALRLVERRFFGVALEQLDDVALAGGEDHEIAAAGVVFEIGNGGVVDHEFAAALGELRPSSRDT